MSFKKVLLSALLVIGLIIGFTPRVSAQMPIRHPIPDSDFPISLAVEIPADASLVYLSGQVPSVTNEAAESGTIMAYGDTEIQTYSVLEKIESVLTSLDLTMGDVVKMQAFLVGDPEMEGKMDFAGFMASYTQFFGTETQPNLPSRSAMQIAGLANPGWLVEIEVVALRSS